MNRLILLITTVLISGCICCNIPSGGDDGAQGLSTGGLTGIGSALSSGDSYLCTHRQHCTTT